MSLYKSYMRLCEKWKVDTSKTGRDLGEFIRQQVFSQFSQGEASNIKDLKECERKLQCLNRLANNHYGKQYKRATCMTASGLTLEQCQEMLSTDSLKTLQEKELGIIEQIKLRLKNG